MTQCLRRHICSLFTVPRRLLALFHDFISLVIAALSLHIHEDKTARFQTISDKITF